MGWVGWFARAPCRRGGSRLALFHDLSSERLHASRPEPVDFQICCQTETKMLYDSQLVSAKKYLLNSGRRMPAVGLSTYRSRSEPAVYNVVDHALDAGYRLFDTSPLFCNEKSLRYAFANLLPKYNLERNDIFIVSKLVAVDDDDYTTIRTSFEQTLSNMGLDYIDLYLVSSSIVSSINLRNAWLAMQTLQKEGFATSIGVANFTVQQLKRIMKDCAPPAVNQVEWHPLKRNTELYKFCNDNHIQIQAYSPFGTPFASYKRLFHNRVIKKVAAKYEVPVSQVILMWSIQQDVAVIPSSHDPAHLKQNIDFELTLAPRDMQRISMLAPYPDDSDPEI